MEQKQTEDFDFFKKLETLSRGESFTWTYSISISTYPGR